MDTKQIIIDSFVKILQTSSFDNITIQKILNDAKISRGSFYRYFKDKYDLMNWYYRNYVDSLMKKYDFSHYFDFIHDTFSFVKENYSYFIKICKVDGDNSFENFLTEYGQEYYEKAYEMEGIELSQKEKTQMLIISAGAGKMLNQWVINGCKESPEDLAEWVSEMLPPDLKKIMKI